MRRAILAAVIGLILLPEALRAEDRYEYSYHENVTTNRFYGAPTGGVPPGYSTFGRRLRGGYGRNGYAPLFGPLWGPASFLPAAGKAPHGPFGRPQIESEEFVAPDAELPNQVVDPIEPPAVPKHPPVAAPALK